MLDKQIMWLETALKSAELEMRSEKFKAEIKQKVEQ